MRRAGNGDRDHSQPEAERFGGDRRAGVDVEQRDQIGRGDDRLAVAFGDQELVLEFDAIIMAAILVDADEFGLAARKAGFRAPGDVRHPAIERWSRR